MNGAAARTIACALVVLVHVNIYVRGSLGAWWPWGVWSAPVFGASVPAFFMLSGWFAEGGLRPGARVRRLPVPFLVWNLVMLATGVEGRNLTTGEQAWVVLTGSWHLYYVFVLGQLLVAHGLVRRFVAPERFGWVLGVAFATGAAAYGVSEAHLWTAGADGGAFEAEARKALPFWAPFYFLGVGLRRGLPPIERLAAAWPWLLAAAAAALPLYVAELRWQDERFGYAPRLQLLLGALPFQLAGGALLVALCRRLETAARARVLNAALAAPAADTYGIYLAHNAALVVLYPALQRAGLTTVHAIEVLWVGAVVWAACWATVRLVRRFAPRPLGALVFGMGPR